ncbi:leucine-rich repeat protein [Tanacetum coccineum]
MLRHKSQNNFICNLATISSSYGGNVSDHEALLSFKSIVIDRNGALSSWNDSFHFCDWSGVTCGKRHKRVTALYLESQGLEGSLSPHIGNLSFLHEFSLFNNSFQGTIPQEFGRLSRLRLIILTRNKFEGFIPANLSGCSELRVLRLGYNELVGSIPKEISFLSKLTYLAVDTNKLTGGIPPFLANITSMVTFSAKENPFGGSIPDTLGRWKSLSQFGSGDCSLSGTIPHSIYNLSLLTVFSLPDNQLTGSLPLEIGAMLPNLEYLQLYSNQLNGVIPPSISNCSKLGLLEIGDNNFRGKLTIDFSKLSDISNISFHNNNLHGVGQADDMNFINSLKNCSRLRVLNLYNCNFQGSLPSSIGNLSNQLEYLDLEGNHLHGNVPSSIGSLVGLTTLDLGLNQLKGKIPVAIGKLQNLQILSLYHNQFSGPIPYSIGNLSSLNTLWLYSNRLERHIPSSVGDCHNLLALSLYDNKLRGNIPKQLLLLPSLTITLNLSQNQLSGSLPNEVGVLKMLTNLDFSNNNLSGEIPMNFKKCNLEQAVYTRRSKTSTLIVGVYVDDLIITGTPRKEIDVFKSQMKDRFEMSDLGLLAYYLGIEVTQTGGEITIKQTGYINKILKETSMTDSNDTKIPMDPGTKLVKAEDGNSVDATYYRSLIGSLRYLLHTRPDLSYSIGLLSRFMQDPKDHHLKAVKQVIRYIRGTKEHGIIYKKEGGCKITGYSDSSYGINTDKGKGTTGIVFYFGESPITWCTQKQPTVALSSCESEFMAATGAACQALWLKRLLSELTGWEEKRVTLKVDNISAIALVRNPVFHGRSKHIDIRYHFIRECVENGHINVEHVSGELQRADILTKALPRLKFVTMRQMLGVQNLGRSNDQD